VEGDVMKRQPWGLYAIALAVLVVGLVALGVPAQTLLFGALVLVCPLMMMLMMGGMHGGHGHGGAGSDPGNAASDSRDHKSTADRR
jgi:peptidoglycan/LPS O-acetylase OafA/YrhL